MRRAISILGAVVLALTFATAALAQDTGRLNGEILDKDGKPYADVTVTIKNAGPKQAAFMYSTNKHRFDAVEFTSKRTWTGGAANALFSLAVA